MKFKKTLNKLKKVRKDISKKVEFFKTLNKSIKIKNCYWFLIKITQNWDFMVRLIFLAYKKRWFFKNIKKYSKITWINAFNWINPEKFLFNFWSVFVF